MADWGDGMRGRALALGLAVALVMAYLGSTTAGAARPNITAVGDAHCVGVVKLTTAVKFVNTDYPEDTTLNVSLKTLGSLSCTGTTGNGKVLLRAAKVTGTYQRKHNCVFTTGTIGVKPGWNLYVQWKGSGGKIASTTIGFTNSEGIPVWDPAKRVGGVILPSTTAPVGSSSVFGSYAGTGTSNAYIVSPPGVVEWQDAYCNNSSRRDKAFLVLNL